MLFNQEEFEHKIEAIKLEKGLKLFVNNKIELVNRTENNVFVFLIDEKISGEISLHLNGGKILSYNCYCKNKNYCEHLAAVNFYLQQEILNIHKTKKSLRKNRTKNLNRRSFLQKYLNAIKTITAPYLAISKLKEMQIEKIIKQINFEHSGASTFKQQFYFHLAVISELTKLTNFNFLEAANELNKLIKNSFNEIEACFMKGLVSTERSAFLEATHYSVRSQANFRTGTFSFLTPRALCLVNDINDLENIKASLKKRKQNKNRLDPFDRKLIAELQLSIVDAKLKGKTYSLKSFEFAIELPVALAQIELCKKKDEKAFKFLEQAGEKIKKINLNKYLDLIDEILIYAKQKKNNEVELNYLSEKFIYGFVINEKDLLRFIELSKEIKTNIDGLLKRLKEESVFYIFEKIAAILLHQNRLDELIIEIKKEKNKFRLLNEIVIKKLPEYNSDLHDLYVKHFVQAITEAKFPYFQEEVFNKAKVFLDLLPAEKRNDIVEVLKEKMLYERHLLQYITKIYPVIT
ncbi:MAG: hypothetical protein H0U95_01540 [Bacteroidetes bacterium]|nr:hypothetical protein [Bacteroidota bacterium]